MAADDVGVARKVTPIASVWCRQVDNEAESPGYTAIPDEFPGRRETLDTIRLVGNLTINVADTHDYWDPAPTQSLSFYPNLFLYPAASGRYTCVGRMFLSTEDRPRLGMKTLVFSTAELFETADFGGTIIRAHATMDGRAAVRRPAVQPDPSVYQIVGEGFLFHRGSTEPVVVVASDQWESVCGAVLQVLRAMPSSLVALGAFLVFPYFLPGLEGRHARVRGAATPRPRCDAGPPFGGRGRAPREAHQGVGRPAGNAAGPHPSAADQPDPGNAASHPPVRSRRRRAEEPRGLPPGRSGRVPPHGGLLERRGTTDGSRPPQGDVADRDRDGNGRPPSQQAERTIPSGHERDREKGQQVPSRRSRGRARSSSRRSRSLPRQPPHPSRRLPPPRLRMPRPPRPRPSRRRCRRG